MAHRGEHQVDVTIIKPGIDASTALLDEMYLYVGMPAAELAHEGRENCLNVLRAAPHPQGTGQATLDCFGAVPQRVGLLQQTASTAYDFLTLSGQPEPAADPIEQWHVELSLQRLNLTRSCWLAQMEPTDGKGKAASVGDGDQGLQLAEIHRWVTFFHAGIASQN
jgi:hypothetical protein